MKIGYISLGCPKNLVDTEIMLGALKERGNVITDDVEGADAVIVNTCSFIREAKEEAIDVILKCARLKEEGKLKYLVVAGCLSQRYKEELANELKEVDAFLGVPEPSNGRKMPRHALTPRHFSYLKIAEGCINRCSYCAVPSIRGEYRSRDMDAVVREARSLIGAGSKELNLIAQDTTLYGVDAHKKTSLASLLEKLCEIEGKFWIRLLYAHPAHLGDDVIEVIKENSKICRYVDLPIQHINDEILTRMRRKATRQETVRLIEKLRREIPGIVLRTSLIVGFPSETEAQFGELLDFVQEAKFDRLGAFAYSPEEGTDAFAMPNQVSERIKKRRLDAVMELQQSVSSELNSRYLGRELEVLVDEKDDGGANLFLARSQGDAPEVDGCIYVRSERKLEPGDFVRVRIVDTLEYDLVGVDEPSQ